MRGGGSKGEEQELQIKDHCKALLHKGLSEHHGAQAPSDSLPEAQRNLKQQQQQQEKDEDVTEWTGMGSHHRETHHKWREMNQAGDAAAKNTSYHGHSQSSTLQQYFHKPAHAWEPVHKLSITPPISLCLLKSALAGYKLA